MLLIMARNTLGKILQITSFGESHGPQIGVVIDGFPAGFKVDYDAIQGQLNRRKPGQSDITTTRREPDEFQIMSGVFEGKTTGAPITILIPNKDTKSGDYENLKNVYRPSHADFTYEKKYGIRDYRGGGRSSARITAGWVAAGALAQQYLKKVCNLECISWVDSIYNIAANVDEAILQSAQIEASKVRCPDHSASLKMEELIVQAKQSGDSLGGTIRGLIRNCPVGIGEPVFGKLNALLAHAFFSINAVKGVEFGDGFDITTKKGSEVNDEFAEIAGVVRTSSNHSGGIQGGISNGEDITFKIAFKPTATILKEQNTVNDAGEKQVLLARGRHDPCVLPRAVPIVDSMAALVLMDLYLENKISRA